jgi:hypothetical protein
MADYSVIVIESSPSGYASTLHCSQFTLRMESSSEDLSTIIFSQPAWSEVIHEPIL